MIAARILPTLALTLLTAPAFGADANGYTAQYECRAGNPKCNVDVAALANQSCQQIVQPSDPWSSIDWSNNVICIAPGNHTAKGTLTIGASGTSGTRKILRYYRSSDTDDEPWNQSAANQATIYTINASGRSHWIFHRLTVNSSEDEVFFNLQSGSNIIVNRVLIESFGSWITTDDSSNHVIQNSVIRSFKKGAGRDIGCINLGNVTNVYIVNNEIYNCTDGVVATDGAPSTAGSVIENNDFYVSGSYVSGTKTCVENAVDIKSGGTAANPVRVIHNRAWGFYMTDTSCGGTGSSGAAMAAHCPNCVSANYVLFQNNIITGSASGIVTSNPGTQNHSLIGNILYDISNVNEPNWQYPMLTSKASNSEMYFNTAIVANRTFAGGPNDDVRCNVFIDSGSTAGTVDAGGQKDYQTYYGTATAGESNVKGNYTLNLESGWTLCTTLGCTSTQDTTGYSVGDIVRHSADPKTDCTSATDSDCFLYKVTSVGVSGQVQAVRGPYTFYRKLRTRPEQVFIPYARAHSSAPENHTCPSTTGNRTGIGINNALL